MSNKKEVDVEYVDYKNVVKIKRGTKSVEWYPENPDFQPFGKYNRKVAVGFVANWLDIPIKAALSLVQSAEHLYRANNRLSQ